MIKHEEALLLVNQININGLIIPKIIRDNLVIYIKQQEKKDKLLELYRKLVNLSVDDNPTYWELLEQIKVLEEEMK